MEQGNGKGLVAHIDQLRTLARLDPETTTLQMAMINVMEELAEAVVGVTCHTHRREHGFGSI